MAKDIDYLDYLKRTQNPYARRHFVFHVSHEYRDLFFFKEGFPTALLPEDGERYAVLGSIPTSSMNTGLLASPKKTSSSVVVCENPSNMFGPMLHMSKLLRKAAARVYLVYEDLTWDKRDTILRGYISTFVLGTDIRFTIFS